MKMTVLLIVLLLLYRLHLLQADESCSANQAEASFCAKSENNFISLNEIATEPWSKSDDILAIKSERDQRKHEFGENNYAFSVLVSDRVGLHRSVGDTRHARCQNKVYENLPRATIIICYHNEALSVLIRMVNSIISRTPAELLHEILLIDDASKQDLIIEQYLKEYKTNNWPDYVKILHTEKREGLMRCRNFGAHTATGEVLVFLDSHCEVNEQWLEPLLDRIQQKPNVVICPIVDLIDGRTFNYSEAQISKGGFNWQLNFQWTYFEWEFFEKDPENYARPYRSPSMSGGLFAIHKAYYHHLGDYDAGMELWGAENIEFSLRIWMCGGELEIHPCSRVGHLFRYVKPYDKNSAKSYRNSARTAEVWLDEYKENYYYFYPGMKGSDIGNYTDRIELRKRLDCKSMKWYLENIYPDLDPFLVVHNKS